MKALWELFSTFFKIGICTFGGGYAMLPMLEREIVKGHGWATMDELLDYFAIGQCTPGIIAVNTATFVGYKRKGYSGCIVATLGIIAPSILIIVAIAALLANFMEYEIVGHAFAGIRIAVCALVCKTILKLAKSAFKKWWHLLVAVCAFGTAAFLKVNTIIIVAATICGGVAYFFLSARKGGENA